jgi:hypothetical protein
MVIPLNQLAGLVNAGTGQIGVQAAPDMTRKLDLNLIIRLIWLKGGLRTDIRRHRG